VELYSELRFLVGPKAFVNARRSGSDLRSFSLTLSLTLSITLPDLNLTIIFPSIPFLVSDRRSEPIGLSFVNTVLLLGAEYNPG